MDDSRDRIRKLATMIASNRGITLDDVRTAFENEKRAMEAENRLLEEKCKAMQEEAEAMDQRVKIRQAEWKAWQHEKYSVLLEQCKDEVPQYERRIAACHSWTEGGKTQTAGSATMLESGETVRQGHCNIGEPTYLA